MLSVISGRGYQSRQPDSRQVAVILRGMPPLIQIPSRRKKRLSDKQKQRRFMAYRRLTIKPHLPALT
jgi:hypothetical protein